MPPLRLVFMGTPELARTILAALADDARCQLVAPVRVVIERTRNPSFVCGYFFSTIHTLR